MIERFSGTKGVLHARLGARQASATPDIVNWLDGPDERTRTAPPETFSRPRLTGNRIKSSPRGMGTCTSSTSGPGRES